MASTADVQRLFLQSFMSRGTMTEKLARLLRERCVAAVRAVDPNIEVTYSNSDASWDAFIIAVNDSLNHLDLTIKFMMDEVTGKRMCILANMRSDEIAQFATEYTIGEIAYFKAVVEQIMLAPREAFSVSSFAALREVNLVKGMTKTQGEIVLASFVASGWLIRSKRGRYSLSLRTILELAPYLKDNYPDEINECAICAELVTKGIACQKASCSVRIHHHCLKTLLATGKKQCPKCSIDWNPKGKDLVPIGEEAAREGDESRRRTRTVEQSDEEVEIDDDDMDKSQTQTQTQSKLSKPSQRRNKGKGKGKGKKSSGKMDVDDDEEEAEEDEEEEEEDEEEEEEEEDVKPAARRRSTRRQ